MAGYCAKCGTKLRDGARFCPSCGATARQPSAPEQPATPPAAAPSTPAAAGPAAVAPSPFAAATSVAGTAGTIAAMGGSLTALPWQTIAAGEAPDVAGIVAAGSPLVQSAVRASIRQPAIALLVTSVLDLACALISGQPAALRMVGIRVGLSLVTAVLGMIAGSKPGPMRVVTGCFSIGSALVSTVSLGISVVAAATNPANLLPLLPTVVAQVSQLVMLVKTTIVSLKR